MNRLKKHKQGLKTLALTGQIILVAAHWACGQSTFTTATGTQAWGTASNWTPSGVPSGTDVAVVFNSTTAAQSVSLGANRVIGSLTIHDTTATAANATTLASTGGYTLSFSASTGNATGLVDGSGLAVETVASAVVLTSPLDLTVSNTAVASASGAVTFTGAMTGAGGFNKYGDGTSSMTTAAKAYTGATTVNAGVLRMSAAGEATGTSSLTVNSGGQFRLDSSSGAFQIGSSAATVITLNGTGDANLSGTTGVGALANYGNGTSTLANVIQLASASSIYTTTTLTLNGAISSTGSLTKVGTGTVNLATTNTYSGVTIVSAGTLSISAAGSINNSNSVQVTAGALTLLNATALSDAGTLSLTDNTTLNLSAGSGTKEVINGLMLNGTPVAAGTYMAADLTALDANITFTGSESLQVLTTVPEPATTLGGAMLIGAMGWSQRRRLGGLAGVMRARRVA